MPETVSLDAAYPAWARDLAQKYRTKTVAQFILHGNVHDLVRLEGDDGRVDYVPLKAFLNDELFARRERRLFYDRGGGITFLDAESMKDFNRAVSGYDTLLGTEYAKALPRDPVRVLSLLDNYLRLRLAERKRIALVIEYAETLIPVGDIGSAGAEDRNALVILKRWAHDPVFLRGDLTICLVTENLAELNTSVVRSPYTEEVFLPPPTEADRLAYLRWGTANRPFAERSDFTVETLAQATAGLSIVHMRAILAETLEGSGIRLTAERLSNRKKELIEAEAYGLLEFVEPSYNLDMVAGHAEAKKRLKGAAEALRQGRSDVLPMGYLINGPVGTGKTFMVTCFAGEIGVPMVQLKNFRSQWQGVTEGNLEKILYLLRAIYPVAVMIDEADAVLGDRNASGDSGVSSRVFGKIAAFMGDSTNRGRILWFLLTARPDLMPVDLKRQGRAEEHLALFYPQTDAERAELFRTMKRKTKLNMESDEIPAALIHGDDPSDTTGEPAPVSTIHTTVADERHTFSGADIEAALVRAKFRAAVDGRTAVRIDDLNAVFEDFIPPTYPLEVELQTLVAVLECTSRELLPPRYRSLGREALVRRIEELRMLIGSAHAT